jgi:hypothetical protein
MCGERLPDDLVSQRGSPTMSDDNARTEKAAASENDWVRARILKQDPPVEGSLLKVAERARDMSARSLGNRHPAYAVALQNLGLYYDAIEGGLLYALRGTWRLIGAPVAFSRNGCRRFVGSNRAVVSLTRVAAVAMARNLAVVLPCWCC